MQGPFATAPGGSLGWHGAAALELSCWTPSFNSKRLCGWTGLSCDVTQASGSCCVSARSAGPAGQEVGGRGCSAWPGGTCGSPRSWRLGVGCLEQAHVSGLRGCGAAGRLGSADRSCSLQTCVNAPPQAGAFRSSAGGTRARSSGAGRLQRGAPRPGAPPRSAGGARSPLGTRGKCQRPGGAAGRSQAGGASVTQPCRRVPAAAPQDERPSPGEEALAARPAPPGGSGRCGRPGAPLLLVHPAG